MQPNKDSGLYGNQQYFGKILKEISGRGIAYVDMFTLHSERLNNKDFISTSSNNINHPNDYIARIYAANILGTLIDYSNLKNS